MGEGERWQRAWRRRSQESADGHRSENRETRPSSVTHEVWYSATARRTSNSAAAVHTFQGRKIMKREREREERDSRKGVQQSSESASLCLQHAHWRQHSRTYSANRAEYYAREGGERRQKREREREESGRERERKECVCAPKGRHMCGLSPERRIFFVSGSKGAAEMPFTLLAELQSKRPHCYGRDGTERKRGGEREGEEEERVCFPLSLLLPLSPFLPFSLSPSLSAVAVNRSIEETAIYRSSALTGEGLSARPAGDARAGLFGPRHALVLLLSRSSRLPSWRSVALARWRQRLQRAREKEREREGEGEEEAGRAKCTVWRLRAKWVCERWRPLFPVL